MVGRLLIVLVALFAGVAASQLPEFAQQYRQRLGGAIDELRLIVGRFDADAQRVSLDRAAALDQMTHNDLPLVRSQAESMQDNIDRLGHLEAQQASFRDAGAFGRLWALGSYFDPMLLHATYAAFEPAVPVSIEAFVLAAIAFVIVWLLLTALVRLFSQQRRPRLRAPPQAR